MNHPDTLTRPLYKMFEETVETTYNRAHDKRRKNEAQSALKRLSDALEETSSEQLGLSSNNLYNNVESRNIDEEQRETSNQTFDLDMAEITSRKSGLKSLAKCSPRYAI